VRRTVTAVAVLLAPAGALLAHEGHAHKVMGKVVAIDAEQIEVESTDGKKVAGVLSGDTKYLRGEAAVTREDVKVGERVVIVVVEDEDGTQDVKQVLLGDAASPEQAH